MATQQNGANDTDEVCPVCKTSSYLNKGLRFLVNPECYHRMCESCVDRIFSSGPAQCPIAGCKKTLRKHRFRKQTFGDLAIERDVDIRKRVMSILNRHEDEFETKRDWDDFLEQREEIIMNLIAKVDVAATEKQLAEYASANEASIKANAALEREESENFHRQHAEQEVLARTRRDASRLAYEDEKRDRAEQRSRLLDQMASTQQGMVAITTERMKVPSKKALTPSSLTIKGIKERPRHAIKENLYDPFMGMALGRDYYTVQQDYPSVKYSKAKNDTRVLTGGYDFTAFYDESMFMAFAGLACFVEDEVKARDSTTSKEAATMVAAST